jgi:hypothetical protein
MKKTFSNKKIRQLLTRKKKKSFMHLRKMKKLVSKEFTIKTLLETQSVLDSCGTL